MSERFDAMEFRKDLDAILEQVSRTGDPVEVETRQGDVLQLSRLRQGSRFANLVPMPTLMSVGPEELVITDWSQRWDADSTVAP